ncbi:hypothetical protein PanWU01x14_263420 [Parasponia andersonii]|uniref:Uncharacterized protein n=1 Tax=Parasponia andersonii TaxID=3476 RepID=A0A2P5B7W3_PARAD|nr:hypothetical protein PanWU01x14_263420 [Parasponia andersonii]
MKLSGETVRPARLEKVSTAPLRGERNRKLFGGKDMISVPINCHRRPTAIGVLLRRHYLKTRGASFLKRMVMAKAHAARAPVAPGAHA